MTRNLLPRCRRDEGGMALLIVVGVAMVLMLMGIAAMTMADGALTSSTSHVNFERSLHLAEEGIDQALGRLQNNDKYHTVPCVPTFSTTAKEEAWARDKLSKATLQETDRGEFAVVKPAARGPVDSDACAADAPEAKVVYAAAWVPSRAEPRKQRVLKVEYIFSTFAPESAILVGSDLDYGGDAQVLAGSVHSNGDIVTVGGGSGSWKVEGDLTASGTFSGNVADGKVSGVWGPDFPPIFVPPINPRSMWDQHRAAYPNDWFDLCDDDKNGVVKKADNAAGPCQGSVVKVLANSGADKSFQGWSFKNSGNIWELNGSAPPDGVYYAYRSNVSVGSVGSETTPYKATIFTEGAPSSPCNQSPVDIHVTGGPVMAPFIPDIQLISGGDVYIGGGSSGKLKGLIGATEQVHLSAAVDLRGSVIAEDRCDTSGSKVTPPNNISGNFSITYEPNLNVALDPYIRTTLWLEM